MPQLLPLFLYREHQNGASIQELAVALRLPESVVEERLTAIRMCLEKQVWIDVESLAA